MVNLYHDPYTQVEGEVEWNEGGGVGDSNTCVVVQMLAERCRTLEQANKRLQEEARTQQRQYEACLDRVATQVVQALLSQKVSHMWCLVFIDLAQFSQLWLQICGLYIKK